MRVTCHVSLRNLNGAHFKNVRREGQRVATKHVQILPRVGNEGRDLARNEVRYVTRARTRVNGLLHSRPRRSEPTLVKHREHRRGRGGGVLLLVAIGVVVGVLDRCELER